MADLAIEVRPSVVKCVADCAIEVLPSVVKCVADRAIEVWPSVVKCVPYRETLTRSRRPQIKSYEQLVECFSDPLVPAKLHFFSFVAGI